MRLLWIVLSSRAASAGCAAGGGAAARPRVPLEVLEAHAHWRGARRRGALSRGPRARLCARVDRGGATNLLTTLARWFACQRQLKGGDGGTLQIVGGGGGLFGRKVYAFDARSAMMAEHARREARGVADALHRGDLDDDEDAAEWERALPQITTALVDYAPSSPAMHASAHQQLLTYLRREDISLTNRVRGDASRRGRGRDLDSPLRRGAAAADAAETRRRRGRDAEILRRRVAVPHRGC